MFSIERQQRDVKFANSTLSDRAIITNRVLIEFLGQLCLWSLHKDPRKLTIFRVANFCFMHRRVSVIKKKNTNHSAVRVAFGRNK